MALFSINRSAEYKDLEYLARASNVCLKSTSKLVLLQKQKDVSALTPISDDLKALARSDEYKIACYVECRQHENFQALAKKYAPFLLSLRHLFPN